MLNLNIVDFEFNNLPYEVDIHRLTENEHRTAFFETFSCFLSANEEYFSIAKDVTVNAKNTIEWCFNNKLPWKENLMNLAETAYDSWDFEFEIMIDKSLEFLW